MKNSVAVSFALRLKVDPDCMTLSHVYCALTNMIWPLFIARESCSEPTTERSLLRPAQKYLDFQIEKTQHVYFFRFEYDCEKSGASWSTADMELHARIPTQGDLGGEAIFCRITDYLDIETRILEPLCSLQTTFAAMEVVPGSTSVEWTGSDIWTIKCEWTATGSLRSEYENAIPRDISHAYADKIMSNRSARMALRYSIHDNFLRAFSFAPSALIAVQCLERHSTRCRIVLLRPAIDTESVQVYTNRFLLLAGRKYPDAIQSHLAEYVQEKLRLKRLATAAMVIREKPSRWQAPIHPDLSDCAANHAAAYCSFFYYWNSQKLMSDVVRRMAKKRKADTLSDPGAALLQKRTKYV